MRTLNPHHHYWPLSPIRLLALCAIALAACAAPAAVPPTATPAPPATATAVPPTLAPTAASTPANVPVPATSIRLEYPGGLAIDTGGNLYLSQCSGSSGAANIFKIDPLGLLQVYAFADGALGFAGDGGPATAALADCPNAAAIDGDGNLYAADLGNNRIRRIDRQGLITTVAGSGPAGTGPNDLPVSGIACGFAGDGGPATAAKLCGPATVAFDPSGNLYIADSSNNRVRKVDQNGIITTVVGTGVPGFAGDGGAATAAQIEGTPWIAFDHDGNLYLMDNNRIRQVDQQGIINTIAATGEDGFSGDGGPARAARFSAPHAIAFDAQDNLYISDAGNQRIRKIDAQGIITTIAGNGVLDLSGDGGPATAASLEYPGPMVFDSAGNLYFIDAGTNRVRKIDRSGIITTVAGGHY